MTEIGKKSTKVTEQFSQNLENIARIRVQHPAAEFINPVTTGLQALLFIINCLLGAVKPKAVACIKLSRPQRNGFRKSELPK